MAEGTSVPFLYGIIDEDTQKSVIEGIGDDDKLSAVARNMDKLELTDKQKIIIDTDCGVDDALAIMLTLSSKDIADLIAITCCYGNTNINNVCSNVMRVLTVCEERKIPIHRGCSGPLLAKSAEGAQCHGVDGLGNSASDFPTGDLQEDPVAAAVALVDYAKTYPNQIALIAIGPLTNVLIAHRLDPAFTANLKSLFIMGGNYKGIGNKTEVAEFNFFCDPEAADIILSEAVCPVTLVPWETTLEYGVNWKQYKNLGETKSVEGKYFDLLAELSREIGYEDFSDSDVLAAVAALYPECVKSSLKHSLAVEVNGDYTRGLVVVLSKCSKEELASKKEIEIVAELCPEFLKNLRRKIVQNVK